MSDDKILEVVEKAKATGKIKKGTNEVTKAVERGTAKMVVVAQDITTAEITMHIPLLCKEKNVPCFSVAKKEELGAAVGIPVGTAAIAVVDLGEAKDALKGLKE